MIPNKTVDMKKFLILLLLLSAWLFSFSQTGDSIVYLRTHYMIPMRDGTLLNTVVLTPLDQATRYPFLIERTPYGVDSDGDQDGTVGLHSNFSFFTLATEGYIFVFQDIRGKFKSQGKMEIHQPLIHQHLRNAVDESTDTWDTIDWLIHNIKNNNGKAGIAGISYPGWLAL